MSGPRVDFDENIVVVIELQSESDIARYEVIQGMASYVKYWNIHTFQVVTEPKNVMAVFPRLLAEIAESKHIVPDVKIIPIMEVDRNASSLISREPWEGARAAIQRIHDMEHADEVLIVNNWGIDCEQLFAFHLHSVPGIGIATVSTELAKQIEELGGIFPEFDMWIYPGITSTDAWTSWDQGTMLAQMQFWGSFSKTFPGTMIFSRSTVSTPKAMRFARTNNHQYMIGEAVKCMGGKSVSRLFCTADKVPPDGDAEKWTMRESFMMCYQSNAESPKRTIELYPGADRFANLPAEWVAAHDMYLGPPEKT